MDGVIPNVGSREAGYNQPARGYPQPRPYPQQPYAQQAHGQQAHTQQPYAQPAYPSQVQGYQQSGYQQNAYQQSGYQQPQTSQQRPSVQQPQVMQPAQQQVVQPAQQQIVQSAQPAQTTHPAQPVQSSRSAQQASAYIPQRQPAPATNPVIGGYKPQGRIMPDPEALAAAFAKNGYAGYLVVHREYTSTRFDPVLTIKNKSIAFNNTCIRRLDDVVYIQLLVNTIENKLVVRPCAEGAKDSIRWCIAKDNTRRTREITCPDFAEKLYKLLSWDDVLRYRLQGTSINYQGEQIYIFDLAAPEAWSPATIVDGKRKQGKRILPEAWADSLGTPVEEHDAFTKIDLNKGYQGVNDLHGVDIADEQQDGNGMNAANDTHAMNVTHDADDSKGVDGQQMADDADQKEITQQVSLEEVTV